MSGKQTDPRSGRVPARRHLRAGGRAAPARTAAVFAALGDQTRLLLLGRLAGGAPQSIAQLTAGSRLTRQAVTKHLRVLESVRLVHSKRAGRESLFALDPQPLDELKQYLARVSADWDQALSRLKLLVEADDN